MKAGRSLLIPCIITAITICLSPLPAISQLDSPSYTVNIYMTPYSQTSSNFSNPFFWGRGTPFFDPWMSSFPFGLSSWFGSWADWNDSDNGISEDSPDIKEVYPLEYLGHAEAVTNGHLVICEGQMFGNMSEKTPISIYDLQLIDITDTTEYKKTGELQFESESGPFGHGEVKKLLIEENLAYILINNPAGFYIIDIEDPNTPELISYQDLNYPSVQDMEIRNGWAFFTFYDYNSIITSWNISEQQDISPFDNIVLDGCVKDLHINQDILLAIGDKHSGLNIIDISEPMGMELVDHLDLYGEAVRMTGGCILTAGGDYDLISKLRIFDYKDFLDLIQVGSLNLPGSEEIVCSKGNIIYVLSNSFYTNQSQIYILLLNEQTFKPEPLTNLKIKGICHNMEIYQNILVISQKDQILLGDITDPSDPEKLKPFKLENSWYLDYYDNYIEEEKEEAGSFFYMDTEWPFSPFFNYFNNPFSSFYPWSFFSSFFSPPGLNWDQNPYQNRGNGPNSYSFTFNNWQLNSNPQGFQGAFGNSSGSVPWEAMPLFGLITDLFRTSSGDIEFMFLD
ncbi:MAG: hypothetical protein ACMUIU_04140 [bacterium]